MSNKCFCCLFFFVHDALHFYNHREFGMRKEEMFDKTVCETDNRNANRYRAIKVDTKMFAQVKNKI